MRDLSDAVGDNPGHGRRLTLFAAGIVGAVGVMSAAAASHVDPSRNLSAIAMICLAHGPALLALGLLGRGRLLATSAALLALGTMTFAIDLGVREWIGHGLVPGAAPVAGLAMIGGWLATALSALRPNRPTGVL